MMRNNARLVGVLVGAIALATPGFSEAQYYKCDSNGKVIRWAAPFNMYASEVSFQPGSGTIQYDAYLHAAWNWNQVFPLATYGYTWPAGYDIVHGDGYSQTLIVDPSHIAPWRAWTVMDRDCGGDHSHWDEMDVELSADLGYQWLDESFNGLGYPNPQGQRFMEMGRATFVHEFGHVWGLSHRFDNLSAMRWSPQAMAGAGVVEPMPTDAYWGRWLYNGLSGSYTNFFASAQGVRADNSIGPLYPYDNPNEPNFYAPWNCEFTNGWGRGNWVEFGITVGNNGTVYDPEPSHQPYLLVFLNTSPTCDSTQYYLGGARWPLPAHSLWTGHVGGTIPTSIPLGYYYTCWKIDNTNWYSEWNESDNRVHGCHRIHVDH
jgi:hypothetical protein